MGTTGSSALDMKKCLDMAISGQIHPEYLVTHIGGLDAAIDATLHLPEIRGGKKLIYTGVDMPLTAIADFAKLGESDPFFAKLHELCAANNGLWSAEAEKYLIETKSI